MLRVPRFQVWLLTIICVTLLLGRLGGAHIHLCFDGKEPPSGFHLFDDGEHHGPLDTEAAHQDVDVAASGDGLSKGKFEFDLPLSLLAAGFLLGLLIRTRQFPASGAPRAALAGPLFLLPPSCGPPLLTSL